MKLWVRCLKPFSYHDNHAKGEVIQVALTHVNDLVKYEYVEIVVNNMGENNPDDVNEKITWVE